MAVCGFFQLAGFLLLPAERVAQMGGEGVILGIPLRMVSREPLLPTKQLAQAPHPRFWRHMGAASLCVNSALLDSRAGLIYASAFVWGVPISASENRWSRQVWLCFATAAQVFEAAHMQNSLYQLTKVTLLSAHRPKCGHCKVMGTGFPQASSSMHVLAWPYCIPC